MKFAYLKYGDLVGPFSRYSPGGVVPDGGPESYLHQFLAVTEGHKRLIISICDTPGSVQGHGAKGWNMRRNLVLPGTPGRYLGAAALWLRALPRLVAFRPDVIVVVAPNYLLSLALAVKAMTGCRVVFSCHSQLWARTGLLGDLLRKLKFRNILRTDSAICHGPYLQGQLLEMGYPRQALVEFNAGHSYLLQRKDGRGLPDSVKDLERFFLYVGRVEREKGALDLLEAFAGISGAEGTSLVYAGEGGAMAELGQRARSGRAAGRVRLLGWIDYAALGGLLEKALAVVVPSWDSCPEGRCKAVSEAHALGIPVIAPDTGFFAYGVRHGEDGLLYEPNSVPGMRAAMEAILGDEELAGRLRRGAAEVGQGYLVPEAIFADALGQVFFSASQEKGSA